MKGQTIQLSKKFKRPRRPKLGALWPLWLGPEGGTNLLILTWTAMVRSVSKGISEAAPPT
ncbi:hypothetical protein QJS10_CPA08g00316 [Acorus calamus]|uniref:Uncharacterized protein n=1 Tax=Acorus calamus TaxID=4465 RepID=A0AAV9ECP0_ACOCL|nr:hypothetical protein QJS10_CPA08g00316 [Acorus calamus]